MSHGHATSKSNTDGMLTTLDAHYVPMDEIVELHGHTVAVNQHTIKKLGLAMAIREVLIALGVKPHGDVLGQLAEQAANEGLDIEDITPETVSGILRACGIQYIHELVFTIKVYEPGRYFWRESYCSSLRVDFIYVEELNTNDTAYFPRKIIDGTSGIHADEIKFTAGDNGYMRLALRDCYIQSGRQKHYEFADDIVDAINTRCDSIHVKHARGEISALEFAKVTLKTTSGTYARTRGA